MLRSGDFLIFLSLKVGNDLFKVDGPGRVSMPWVRDPDLELRLFEGRVGIPLIDAAIRNSLRCMVDPRVGTTAGGELNGGNDQFDDFKWLIPSGKLTWIAGLSPYLILKPWETTD